MAGAATHGGRGECTNALEWRQAARSGSDRIALQLNQAETVQGCRACMLVRLLRAFLDSPLLSGQGSLADALAAFQKGDLATAESQLEQLWKQHPDAAIATLQGQVLRASGRWQESISWFRRALDVDRCDPRPAVAIGQLLRQLGQHDEAQTCFEEIVQHTDLGLGDASGDAIRPLCVGLALAELGQLPEAIRPLEQAITIDPDLIEARQTLATVLERLGRISAATLQQAALATLEPANISPRLAQALAEHQMGNNAESLRQLELLLRQAPQAVVVAEAFQFVSSTAGTRWLEKRRTEASNLWTLHGASTAPPQPVHVEGRALRVGILSADLGSHPVGHFLEGILRHYDRQRLHLELIETQPRWEPRNLNLRQLADATLLLPQADQAARRELIGQRQYDVIIETSGFTTASGLPLLSERLAPVQCHYVGFHASTLLPSIDWFIADWTLLPEELDDQFSERIWRLPRPWAAYTAPASLPPVNARQEDEPLLFGSCNQTAKLSPETLQFWAAALTAVPHAELLVKHRFAIDPQVRRRLIDQLNQLGVAPTRLHVEGWAADWAAHMETYNRMDIALDATPWSSATTAFEALAMGTPLIAIRGSTMAGRMSCAVLEGYGEPGWIAESPADFAAIARDLAGDLAGLRSSRAVRRERAQSCALFNSAELTEALTTALEQMCRQS